MIVLSTLELEFYQNCPLYLSLSMIKKNVLFHYTMCLFLRRISVLPVLCYFSYPKQVYIEDINNNVLMPTFLDITGLEDEESEINKEMLSISFNGKLKEGEDLTSVLQFYFNNGRDIHTLRQFL